MLRGENKVADIVNVRLNDVRLLPFSCSFSVERGNNVVVEIDGINEFGTVETVGNEQSQAVGNVVRIATTNDIEQNKRMLSFQDADTEKVRTRVNELGLVLKLVAVLRSLDSKKILVMYTADDRVDFRQLVKDLAGIFKMRVEMRQISERDEAKFHGGCGACGQILCCRRFLNIPRQTSIKMAKVQGIALTPNKVNGVCGKLMCCLQYEYSQYREIMAKMPPINSIVETPHGKGTIAYLDLLGEKIAVKLDDATKPITKYTIDEVKVLVAAKDENADDGEE